MISRSSLYAEQLFPSMEHLLHPEEGARKAHHQALPLVDMEILLHQGIFAYQKGLWQLHTHPAVYRAVTPAAMFSLYLEATVYQGYGIFQEYLPKEVFSAEDYLYQHNRVSCHSSVLIKY